MKARPAQARSARKDVLPAGRKQRRAVLPSGRVVAFKVPNVGEHMSLTERAIANVQRRSPKGVEPVAMEYSNELAALGVRELLVGMTSTPVPEIYRNGVTVEKARAQCDGTLRAQLAGEGVAGEDADAEVANRLPELVDAALALARDGDAMCAAANLVPVNDWEWTEGRDVGDYLRRMPNADLGAPEAEDWVALHRIALIVARPATPGSDPKAGTRTKPWMLSSAG